MKLVQVCGNKNHLPILSNAKPVTNISVHQAKLTDFSYCQYMGLLPGVMPRCKTNFFDPTHSGTSMFLFYKTKTV